MRISFEHTIVFQNPYLSQAICWLDILKLSISTVNCLLIMSNYSNFRLLSLLQRLCDNDPGVMGATLCPLFDLITEDVNSYKDLVMSFVSILKQVVERRLPKNYDYHQMPAPFIQVQNMEEPNAHLIAQKKYQWLAFSMKDLIISFATDKLMTS